MAITRFGLKPVSNRHYDALSRIGWEAFERLLAEHYRDQGFVVDHCGTGASSRTGFDGGIDLKLRRGEEYVLVQCKHENVYKVTHNPVHELLGVMTNERATGAILVTSGEFTDAALEAGRKLGHVQLIDGLQLRVMLADQLKTLPQPPPPPPRPESTGRWEKVGEGYGTHQAEGRRSSSRSRRSRDDSRDEVLIKGIAGAAMILALIFIVPGMIQRGFQSLLSKPAVATPEVRQLPPVQPTSRAYQPGIAATQHYPIPPAQDISPPVPTPQQIAKARQEQALRDAETKRVLDNMNIPEVTHYRYSPLDQNKPAAESATPASESDDD